MNASELFFPDPADAILRPPNRAELRGAVAPLAVCASLLSVGLWMDDALFRFIGAVTLIGWLTAVAFMATVSVALRNGLKPDPGLREFVALQLAFVAIFAPPIFALGLPALKAAAGSDPWLADARLHAPWWGAIAGLLRRSQ